MRLINLNDASDQLDDLIHAAIGGEEIFIVTVDNQAIQLVPTAPTPRRRIFGSAKGMVKFAEDFDAPLTDFDEYTK